MPIISCTHPCRRQYRHYVFAAALPLVGACGSTQLPVGAHLSVSPASRDFEIVHTIDADEQCVFHSDNYLDVPISVAVTDAQQSPLGGIRVAVHADFTASGWQGLPVFGLFVDHNGNGVVDDASEEVGGPENPVLLLTTGSWTGTAAFFLRVNLSCPFAGRVLVTSGALAARTHITVRSRGSLAQPGVAS